jgi:glucokinase
LIDSAKNEFDVPPSSAGISFGGPVAADGSIRSMHVRGWENVDLIGEIASAFDLERSTIRVENDANAGALGEHRCGAGRGCAHMLYFTVSTGIGGGVILNNRLWRGAHGFAGEFGHMVLDDSPAAPQYATGKPGALEALASGPALARDGKAALLKERATGSGCATLEASGVLSAKDVFAAAARGEAWALETRDRAARHLGRGIAAAICAFDVERVVIGGGVALAGAAFFEPLQQAVDCFLPLFAHGKVELVPAFLGDQAPLFGAAVACIEARHGI